MKECKEKLPHNVTACRRNIIACPHNVIACSRNFITCLNNVKAFIT